MSSEVVTSGTQTATIGVEHSLTTQTANRTYRLAIDLANLANGDVLELRYKRPCVGGGTARQAAVYHYADAQADPLVLLDAIEGEAGSLEVTLKQTAGTGRQFAWTLLSLDGWGRNAHRALWNKQAHDLAARTKTIYEDDGSTAARTFNVTTTATGSAETPA